MSERLKFLGKFLLFGTLIFVLFYLFGYSYYYQLIRKIVFAIYRPTVPAGLPLNTPISITYSTRFYNIVPFLALILATPGIKLFKRLKLMGLGLIIIFLVHLLFIAIGHTYSYENPSLLQIHLTAVWEAIGQVAFPLLLWLILAHRYVIPTFRPRKMKSLEADTGIPCPICGKKKKGLREHILVAHRHEQGIEELLKEYTE